MKSLHEIIHAAQSTTASLNLQHANHELKAELARLNEPGYRVGFVGQFKTGKSTLLNRLFLKEDLLFTDVLEATSIPTEVTHGTPRLEVYRYIQKSFEVTTDDGTRSQSYVSNIVLDRVIDNPSPHDIRNAVSAETPEGRTILANTFSHARLSWPAENLRQFTVIDTPGVNSTTEAVVTTTHKILPTCDVALYVAPPKQLDQADLAFLRNHVFESGLTRTLVILNYNPDFNDLAPETLENIRTSVQAQLAEIGRTVPVHIAEIPRKRSGLPSGGLGSAVTETNPLVFLDTPLLQPVAPEPLPIEQTLINFFQNNVRPGREEKAGIRVRRILEKTIAECEVELALLKQADVAKAAAEAAQIRSNLALQNTRREALRRELVTELRSILAEQKHSVRSHLDTIRSRLLSELRGCHDFSATKDWLDRQKQSLPFELDMLCRNLELDGLKRARALETKYETSLRKISEDWTLTSGKLDGGFLESVPSLVVTSLDYLLAVMIGPFGIIGDLLGRLLVSKIPFLQDLLPTNLTNAYFKNSIESNLTAQFQALSTEVDARIDSSIEEAVSSVESAWNEQNAENARILEEALQRGTQPSNPARIGSLEKAVHSLKALLPELPALSATF